MGNKINCKEEEAQNTISIVMMEKVNSTQPHLKQPFSFFLLPECICVCISLQSFPQKRQCVYEVTPQNDVYSTVGLVNGSVQLCENTNCCVGYYVVVNGEPVRDVLGKKPSEKLA